MVKPLGQKLLQPIRSTFLHNKGLTYKYLDEDVRNRKPYYCKLENIDLFRKEHHAWADKCYAEAD